MQHRMARAALAAAVGLTALVAPPAASAASTAADAVACATGTSAGLPGGFAAPSTARGAVRDREFRTITPDSTIPSGSVPATGSSFRATVPVVFHVIASSRTAPGGWVTDSQIADQMRVLNETFVGSGFAFRLQKVTRTVSAEWFEMATFADEVAAKQALREGDATTLNLYTNSGGGALGFAYYPSIVNKQYAYLDGVVVDFGTLPGGKVRNYDMGFTATHEVGHWLGLAHTFEGGCTGKGDEVGDTPAEATATSGWPEGKDTCTSPGLDPIHNYMDYSYDRCYTEFTGGQGHRMQEQYLHWREKVGY